MKSKLLLATSIFTLSILYGCLDEVTEASAPDVSELACKTEPLDDDSGLKVICGGDSVGVVLNGKDGKDGKDGEDGKSGADGKNGKDGTNGKDGLSCYVTENAEINGYDVFCGDEKIGSIVNGKDGKNGENGANGKDGDKGDDGKDGKDGTSCTVEVNDDINGFDVVCAGKKVGELRNGKDGEKGADGTNGTNGKDGKDGTSCTVEVNDDINGFDVICGDKKVGELRNGKDGEKGADGTNGTNGKDGKDGTSCTVEENKEIDGYDVICADKKVGEIHNGKDGQDGKNGTDGKDGTSCSVVKNEKVNGYEVYCGTEFLGFLTNGKDGADGKNGIDGKDGTSCTVEENKEIDGYDVICADKKVGEIHNGKDGQDGKNGTDGKDGTSCSVVKNEKVNGYEVYCGTEFLGFLTNGKDGADGKNGIDGKDGTSCTVEVNDDIDGYDVICADKKVGELRNGKDAVLPSSSSIASSSSATPSSSSKVSSSSVAPSSSSVASSSSVTPSSSSVASSSSETPSSSSVEQLSEKCKTLRATTDVFNSLYDVLGCTRSTEKVAIILRHAARDRNNYGKTGGLNDIGKNQSKQVGENLKALNLEGFYYMHTDVKRTAETAMIISNNKGESTSSNISDWYDTKSNDYQNENTDLLESWYVKPGKSVSNCQRGNSWGWSVYSKFAYEEYIVNNYDATQACKDALYDAKSRTQEIVEKYFSYEKAHKYTLAISHDQFLVPFIIAISDKKIHDIRKNKNGQYYDLRFHAHDSEGEPEIFNYWINYLTGVVIITDGTFTYDEETKQQKENFIIIPVKALDDGFLRNY